jgi:hypothetical protein
MGSIMAVDVSVVVWWLSALAALALGVIVIATGPGRPVNRALASLLALEGLSVLTLGLLQVLVPLSIAATENDTFARVGALDVGIRMLRDASVSLLCAAYLTFLGNLDTPLVRPFRRPVVRAVVWIVFAGFGVYSAWGILQEARGGPQADAVVYGFYGLLGLFALAASVHAAVRSPRGSITRRRSIGFVASFGVRDVATIAGIVIFALAQSASPSSPLWLDYALVTGVGTLAFVALLSYALLRTQLFDIDLRIKVGIRRGTVVAMVIVGALIVFEIAQAYLSRVFGFVAGAAATGVLVFLSPRLNKLADKVSDAALPKVQPTAAYLSFKKLEVYKAAVETAHETGGIDARERAKLDRLREKLALNHADCAAVEAELGAGPIAPA